MNQFAKYLQQHLDGEVLTGDDIRDYFATDASVFTVKPKIVIYPRHEVDIRKVLLWCDQFANKGLVMPVTARGGGTDLAGAALSNGIVLVLSAHLNKLLEFESRKGYFRLQPGCLSSQWQQFLYSHERFFPPIKNADPGATIGGAVANNSGSHYSEKYGLTGRYIRRLRVVLSNGEIITARRLSRRQTLRKVYQSTLEGEIYRQLIQLWPRYEARIDSWPVNHHTGYDLRGVRLADGGYNLIPLLVGAQGTLGVISEIEVATAPYNPVPMSALLPVNQLKDVPPLVAEIKRQRPAALEIIDGLSLIRIQQLVKTFFDDYPFNIDKLAAILLVEFDNASYRNAWRRLKKVIKKAEYYGVEPTVMSTALKQQQFDRLRGATSLLVTDASRGTRALPGLEDSYIPLDRLLDFHKAASDLFKKHRLNFMFWGNIGLGQIRTMPRFNLSETSSQSRYLRLIKDYWQLVASHGGQTNCLHNDGRLRGVNIHQEIDKDLFQVMTEIKTIFDPFNILNPQAKFGASWPENNQSVRSNYDWGRFYQNLPRL